MGDAIVLISPRLKCRICPNTVCIISPSDKTRDTGNTRMGTRAPAPNWRHPTRRHDTYWQFSRLIKETYFCFIIVQLSAFVWHSQFKTTFYNTTLFSRPVGSHLDFSPSLNYDESRDPLNLTLEVWLDTDHLNMHYINKRKLFAFLFESISAFLHV